MERAEIPALRDARVASLAARAEGLGPESVLRRGAGEVRGFWARGRRWVAHVGAVAGVRVEEGSEEPGTRNRFEAVRRRGRALLEAVDQEGASAPPPVRAPRLYGGFSFRHEPRREAFWGPFPPASFVLPELEVVGDEEGAWVSLRRPVSGGEAEPWEELGARLDALIAALRPGGEGSGTGASPDDGRGRAGPPRLRETARDAWEDAVSEAVEAIRQGAVEKVVLARTLDLSPPAPVDPVDAALRLWEQNPGTHVFLYEPMPGSALVGAAPETVATVADGRFRATAVAGSIGRGRSPEEQEALALRLLESEKDRDEHRIAVEDMVARLRPLSEALDWDSEPHVLTLSRIQHLETRIQATLRRGAHVLDALAAVHPTPAVCGLPRDAALEFLRVEEPFDRGWYAGPVGWFDARGDGVFAPALRCAVSRGEAWRLFAGAGIVSASVPSLEWEETRIKFQPALRALAPEVTG